MKRLNKVLVFLTSAVMATSAMSGLSAYAFGQWGGFDSVITNPDTDIYEEYTFDSKRVVYRRIDDPYMYYTYKDFKYNYLTCIVEYCPNVDDIYSKYSRLLNFDYSKFDIVDDGMRITMYDVLDEWDDPREANSINDKQGIIKRFCSELQECGCLVDAEYVAFKTTVEEGQTLQDVHMDNFTGTLEEIQAVVDKYADSASVELNDDNNSYDIIVEDIAGFSDFVSMYDELNTLCDTASISVPTIRLADLRSANTNTINVLNVIGDNSNGFIYGDLNADGKIGISDAIILNKAITGVIILNTDQEMAADVNVDRKVDPHDLFDLLSFLVDNIYALPVMR